MGRFGLLLNTSSAIAASRFPAAARRWRGRSRGFTQVELAEPIRLIQTLVCDYEKDRFRLSAEMTLRFALALEISVDELLRSKSTRTVSREPRRRVLPVTQPSVLLKTIDSFGRTPRLSPRGRPEA